MLIVFIIKFMMNFLYCLSCLEISPKHATNASASGLAVTNPRNHSGTAHTVCSTCIVTMVSQEDLSATPRTGVYDICDIAHQYC